MAVTAVNEANEANEPNVTGTIVDQLARQGYRIAPEEYEADLVGAGVNSVNLVRLLSVLEEEFDVEFAVAELFREPVTVARLAAEIHAQIGEPIDAEADAQTDAQRAVRR
ncbi:Phosphopantetheine attachment site [Streptomyces sp. 1331.2]|nr:Phosphopantetheine attachment site [Streptomyces sp. 1331.2]